MVKELISKYKTLLLLLLSTTFILIIYRQFEWNQLIEIARQANLTFLILGCLLSIFLGYLSSIRYSYFASKISTDFYLRIYTSVKCYFISSCFNLLLPSKLGDLSKGFIAQRLENKKYPNAIHAFTLYEKASDLFALLIIGLITSFLMLIVNISPNLYTYIYIPIKLNFFFLMSILTILLLLFFVLAPIKKLGMPRYFIDITPKKVIEIFNFNKKYKWKEFYLLLLSSTIIWLIHILQMLIFANAIDIQIWNLSGVFILIFSILIGLLPLSFAGIGIRDASLVYFLSPILGNTKPLILGILLTSRYLIPALIGLIFLNELKGKK